MFFAGSSVTTLGLAIGWMVLVDAGFIRADLVSHPDEDPAVRIGKKTTQPDLAIRMDQMKLLCNFDGSGAMLFNVVRDPGERRNLADEQTRTVARLKGELFRWYEGLPSE